MPTEEEYGSMNVLKLKQLLKERNASVSGKKKDLVDRLIYYDKNNNFGYEPLITDDSSNTCKVITPAPTTYRDINASSPLPLITMRHIEAYLARFQKNMGSAVGLYKNSYLTYIRYSILNFDYFIRGQCRAEMRKSVKYEANVKIALDGEVEEACCECAAGNSTQSHCKHVSVLLLALEDMASNGNIVLEKTTTEQLQTFHVPAKKFKGSPLKASEIQNVNENETNRDPSSNSDEDYQQWYRAYFRNVIVSRGFNSTMPIKQLIEPANPYALEWDHCYTKHSMQYSILNRLHLIDVTAEDARLIEISTKGQHSNALWHELRKYRITASKFYDCCNASTADRGRAIAHTILNPQAFTSRATSHGNIYESIAVNEYMERFDGTLEAEECGLFIMPSHPYLGASPDRLLVKLTVIEVKCPYTSRRCDISPVTVPYIEIDQNNCLRLKRSHGYYYQIQGQLMVTGRKFCDLVIYTFTDLVHISIERDEQFIDDMLQKLTQFYDTYFKPAILEKYLYRNYSMLRTSALD